MARFIRRVLSAMGTQSRAVSRYPSPAGGQAVDITADKQDNSFLAELVSGPSGPHPISRTTSTSTWRSRWRMGRSAELTMQDEFIRTSPGVEETNMLDEQYW